MGKYIEKSLKELQLDYLDMYSVHAPFGVFRGDSTDYTEMQRDDSTDHLKIWKVKNKLLYSISRRNYNSHTPKKKFNVPVSSFIFTGDVMISI